MLSCAWEADSEMSVPGVCGVFVEVDYYKLLCLF